MKGQKTFAFLAILCAITAACSAILGLDPPPLDDAGMGDTGPRKDGPSAADTAPTDASTEAFIDAVPCSDFDAATPDGVTYYPLAQSVIDDAGNTSWEFFGVERLNRGARTFIGATFDGRYLYLAGRGNYALRYDTTSTVPFNPPETDAADTGAWAYHDFSATFAPGEFIGAVFDGRYVYFIPNTSTSGKPVPVSTVVRYDTQNGSFIADDAWSSFNLSTLDADGGLGGFAGGTFDGRYLYLVPNNNGAPDGTVVRYDTEAAVPDAGDGGRDGGAPGDPFTAASSWSAFNLATVDPAAIGFFGGVFDGTYVYFAPHVNDVFGSRVHSGLSSIAARLDPSAGFEDASAWSTFDLTNVNGLAFDYSGAGFDGRYVYFAPNSNNDGIVMQFDTEAGAGTSFNSPKAWSSYDLKRIVSAPDGAVVAYGAITFDGRFVYFAPSGTGFATIVRYDTQHPFTADCAWTTLDLTEIDSGASTLQGVDHSNFRSVIFDGEYLYLVPNGGGPFARFRARSSGPLPLPDAAYFRGSFL